ncbi:unnamed protein product [Effrenium voratum]|uniref:Uncharacterized protein n=1 Tax=Effrenium voratum TaxID=2562239 RepID=A0AA36IMF9_9DINO|nr:unnamed protein product [Effrenium voratum]CAJ1455678.1 unnamed protein product [Effrenium voratum]
MDCEALLAQLTQQVVQEHLNEEGDSVYEASRAPSPPGRFTSRRKPRNPPASQVLGRPARLMGGVRGAGGDPFDAEGTQAETPAMRHLALLEEAVLKGTELPPLCSLTGGSASSAPKAKVKVPPPPRAVPDMPDAPRLLVTEGTWGLQPPASSLRRSPAALAAPLGCRTSHLRGSGLARKGAGAAQTALWVSMEAERLREEARHPKSLGVSFATAFLVNRGPERMQPLSARLSAVQPIGN